MNEVVVMAGETSRHESWESAIERVVCLSGAERAALWLRSVEEGVFVFDAAPPEAADPIAWVTDPVQYRRAASRGDLEDADDFLSRRAGGRTPARHLTQAQTTMSKAQTKKTAKPAAQEQPASISYYVEQEVVWKSKRRTAGTVFDAPQNHEDRKLELYLRKGWIRVAAEGDIARAATSGAPAASPSQTVTERGDFMRLDPATIAPSPVNPRRHFDRDAMDELVASVTEHGVRQPIQVRPMPEGAWLVRPPTPDFGFWSIEHRDRPLLSVQLPTEIFRSSFPSEAEAAAGLPKYEIIAGERRWRAAQLAKSKTIRAIVEPLDDVQAAEMQAVENLQRADLSPIEEANGYRYMLDHLAGYNMARLVASTGKSESAIRGKLKLLNLPDAVQTAVEEKKLAPATAEMIGRLKGDMQKDAIEQILLPRGGVLSFDDAKEVISELKEEQDDAEKRATKEAEAEQSGYTVLRGEEGAKIVYGDTLAHGCGYVLATEECPRDPLGRSWQDLVEEAGEPAEGKDGGVQVTRFAVVGRDYHAKGYKIIPVFLREAVNALLKEIGLWTAEGSAAAKAKEKKQVEKQEAQRKEAEMLADFGALVKEAEMTKSPRGSLLAAVFAMTHNDAPKSFLAARRRGWVEGNDQFGRSRSVLLSMATDLEIRELRGLVVELAALKLDSEFGYFSHGREQVRHLLEGDEEFTPEEETAEFCGLGGVKDES